jgi:hypothetical protein
MKDNGRPAGFFQAAKMIFWAFFGVRQKRHGESDFGKLTPLQIVVAGILGGAVFVMVLVLVVRAIVQGHGATT